MTFSGAQRVAGRFLSSRLVTVKAELLGSNLSPHPCSSSRKLGAKCYIRTSYFLAIKVPLIPISGR